MKGIKGLKGLNCGNWEGKLESLAIPDAHPNVMDLEVDFDADILNLGNNNLCDSDLDVLVDRVLKGRCKTVILRNNFISNGNKVFEMLARESLEFLDVANNDLTGQKEFLKDVERDKLGRIIWLLRSWVRPYGPIHKGIKKGAAETVLMAHFRFYNLDLESLCPMAWLSFVELRRIKLFLEPNDINRWGMTSKRYKTILNVGMEQ